MQLHRCRRRRSGHFCSTPGGAPPCDSSNYVQREECVSRSVWQQPAPCRWLAGCAGFNCGEAVNFGTADWIPFSTAAERRYAILRHSPLLCHEEVLVKEAQRLWGRFHASAPQEGAPRCQAAGPPGLPLTVRQRPAPGAEDAEAVMREFVQLLRLHDRATWWLVHKRGARRTTLPQLSGPMPCSLCLRLCYLSVITCACQPEPICLHHGERAGMGTVPMCSAARAASCWSLS